MVRKQVSVRLKLSHLRPDRAKDRLFHKNAIKRNLLRPIATQRKRFPKKKHTRNIQRKTINDIFLFRSKANFVITLSYPKNVAVRSFTS